MSDLNDHIIADIIKQEGGNFTPGEFGIGRQHGNPEVIRQVVRMRNWCGNRFQITSFWRNKGSHSEGAVDWIMWHDWRDTQPDPEIIWLLATTWPWLGVGIYFDWNDGIGLHGDLAASRHRPLRWIRARGTYYYQSTADGKFYSDEGVTTLEDEIQKWNENQSSS